MSVLEIGRGAARIEGDFLVSLIGARINNRLRSGSAWLPVVHAMPRMPKELARQPELGLLHGWTAVSGLRDVLVVQYWRSFELLYACARARGAEHLPAWAACYRALEDDSSVGIWHETDLVRAGACEAVYGDMPRRGLPHAGDLVEASGRARSALGRLGRSDGADQPLADDGAPRDAA